MAASVQKVDMGAFLQEPPACPRMEDPGHLIKVPTIKHARRPRGSPSSEVRRALHARSGVILTRQPSTVRGDCVGAARVAAIARAQPR